MLLTQVICLWLYRGYNSLVVKEGMSGAHRQKTVCGNTLRAEQIAAALFSSNSRFHYHYNW